MCCAIATFAADLWHSRLVEVIAGGIIAAIVALVIERLRRPRLEMKPGYVDLQFQNLPAQHMRGLRVDVHSLRPPKYIRWVARSPASRCKATITFHHLDGRNVFGRSMTGRWSSTPEPFQTQIIPGGSTQIVVFDPTKLQHARVEIYPAEQEALDIAVRLDNDAECYGWNNDSYLHSWRNPNWKLVPGRYLVRVEVTSSGEVWEDTFLLVNDVPRGDCRLEPASKEEMRKIRAS